MSMYHDVSETPLRFHKLNRFLLMPLSILFHVWFLVSIFLELCHVEAGWLLPVLADFPYADYPAAFILWCLYALLTLVLLVRAEIYAGRWIRTSYTALLAHYGTGLLFHVFFFVFLYLNELYDTFAANMQTGISATGVLLIMIFAMVILVIYDVMALTYYIARRHLYIRLVAEKKPAQPETGRPEEKTEPEESAEKTDQPAEKGSETGADVPAAALHEKADQSTAASASAAADTQVSEPETAQPETAAPSAETAALTEEVPAEPEREVTEAPAEEVAAEPVKEDGEAREAKPAETAEKKDAVPEETPAEEAQPSEDQAGEKEKTADQPEASGKKGFFSHFPKKKGKTEEVKPEPEDAEPAPEPIPFYKKDEPEIKKDTEVPAAETAEAKSAEADPEATAAMEKETDTESAAPVTEAKAAADQPKETPVESVPASDPEKEVQEETAAEEQNDLPQQETAETESSVPAKEETEKAEEKEKSPEEETSRCPYCGAELKKDALFCSQCGHKL